MKHKYANGRGTPFAITIYKSRYLSSFRKLGVVTLLICLFSFHFVCFAQESRESGMTGIEEIKSLQIGDTIPEELWNMPLQVVNHPDGKEMITLNEYRNQPFVLLEFWSRHCAPCIRALDKFEKISNSFKKGLPIISVYVDKSDGLSKYIKQKQWNLATVINNTTCLNDYFFNTKQYGGLVLIVEDIFYASPGSKDFDREVFQKLLNNERLSFSSKYPELLHSDEGRIVK